MADDNNRGDVTGGTLDEQMAIIDDLIAKQEELHANFVQLRGEAPLMERLLLLEEQMHGVQLAVLHQAKANLQQTEMHKLTTKNLELQMKIDKQREEAVAMLRIFLTAKTIGRA